MGWVDSPKQLLADSFTLIELAARARLQKQKPKQIRKTQKKENPED
jgi:hypothetical protein